MSAILRTQNSVHPWTKNAVLTKIYGLKHEECNSKMHLMMQVFWDVILCHSAQVIPDILRALQSFKTSRITWRHTKSLSSISWNYYNKAQRYLLLRELCSITADDLQQQNTFTQSRRFQSTGTPTLHEPLHTLFTKHLLKKFINITLH